MIYNPVGHVVEAIKIAKGLAIANRNLEIHLMLNARSAIELPDACPWITNTYAIDTFEVQADGIDSAIFQGIPNVWDYILMDNRPLLEFQQGCEDELDLVDWYQIADQYFQARLWKGLTWQFQEYPESLRYNLDNQVQLELPREAVKYIEGVYFHNASEGPNICVLLAGSSNPVDYPSINGWKIILKGLFNTFPGLRIFITGKLNADARTISKFPQADLDRLFDACPSLVNCYDIGLWNQVALIQACDLFVSPHSGFGFLAPCVGTPWLTLTGSITSEYFFNGVPFYSIFPTCGNYPCYMNESWLHEDGSNIAKVECRERRQQNERMPCMDDERVKQELPEIIQGTRLLLTPEFSFEQALECHVQRLRSVNQSWVFESPFISREILDQIRNKIQIS